MTTKTKRKPSLKQRAKTYTKYDPSLSWEENVELSRLSPAAFSMPYVCSDIPAYVSPATGKMIEGRAARKEDLKISGCREVDPSEYKPIYKNYAFCQKHRKPYMGGDIPPPMTRDEKMESKERRAKMKAAEKAADAIRAAEAAKHVDPDLAKFQRGNTKTDPIFSVRNSPKASA